MCQFKLKKSIIAKHIRQVYAEKFENESTYMRTDYFSMAEPTIFLIALQELLIG